MEHRPAGELEMARRHVAEAEARIARQHRIIDRLRRCGASTALAEQLLASMVETIALMRAHRDMLEPGAGG
jgi:hypothetical protein